MAHKLVEVAKSEFEYFSPQAIQNSIIRAFKREFTPVSALQHGAPIEFYIPGVDNLYMDLSKSYMMVLAQIQTAAGAAPAADTVGPINNVLHSMFQSVDVELNGKPVSDANGLYPFRAYLETILSYEDDAAESQLQLGGWYKDTAGQLDTFTCTAASANVGLANRARLFTRGAQVELIGRPHSDLFQQPRAIPSNVPMKVKFVPSRDSFALVTPAPAGGAAQELYKLVIVQMRLFIHTYEVSPHLQLAHQKMLAHVPMQIPEDRVATKYLTIPQNQTQVNFDNIYLGEIPNRIAFGMLTDAALTGGYQQNPFNFQHFGVNYLALYVNGELIPSRPFQPNFASGQHIRELASTYEAMGVLFANKGICINRNDFANGFAIFVFDLTPDQNCGHCLSPPRTGTVRLELKFAAATTQTIDAVLHASYDAINYIDKYLNVTTTY